MMKKISHGRKSTRYCAGSLAAGVLLFSAPSIPSIQKCLLNILFYTRAELGFGNTLVSKIHVLVSSVKFHDFCQIRVTLNYTRFCTWGSISNSFLFVWAEEVKFTHLKKIVFLTEYSVMVRILLLVNRNELFQLL